MAIQVTDLHRLRDSKVRRTKTSNLRWPKPERKPAMLHLLEQGDQALNGGTTEVTAYENI